MITQQDLANAILELKTAQQKTDAQIDRLEAAQEKTDAQLAKTDAKLGRLAEMYGGVGNNQGAVAEEFYFNSLKANPVLGGTRFDFIDKNITRGRGQLEDEFDLLLVNGQEVFVIEVKYKAHTRDLERLLEAKAVNFQELFPEYANYRQRWGLATFHIHDDLKKAALDQGVAVLQRKGKVIETFAA